MICAALLAIASNGLAAPPTGSIPGAYLVLEVLADGTAVPVHVARVPLARSAAFGLRRLADAPAATAAVERFTVRLRDRRRRVVFQDAIDVSRVVRGEFHGAVASEIDGHHLPASRQVFVVRTPLLPSATLEVLGPGTSFVASELDMDSLLAGATIGEQPAAARANADLAVASLPGWAQGSSENRVDLLVVGDGYTASEEDKFAADALAVVGGMFEISPYAEYQNLVNVRTLFVASAESGADEPPYQSNCSEFKRAQSCCGDSSAPATATYVSTAFDATFCSFNIERLLTVDATKVLTAAAAVPEWDQILVIVNSTRYGGSGGGFSVISTNLAAVAVAQHEYGHTFTRLADEYSSAYPGYPACSDTAPGATRCERNVTDETSRELVKWARWIEPGQPIPSSGPPPLSTDAGLWAGARYQASGMYRQGYLCIMRALGAPFCDVGAEAYVLRLGEGGWGVPSGGIDWIEPGTETPPPGTVVVDVSGATFAATLLAPVGGAPLDVRWYVDDVEAAATTASTGARVEFPFVAPPGPHSVELRVVDHTGFVHPTLEDSLARSRIWNVSVVPPTTTTTTLAPTTTLVPVTTTSLGSVTTTTFASPTTTGTTTTTVPVTTTTTPTTTTTLHLPTTTTTLAPTTTSTLAPTTTLPGTTTLGPATTTTLASEPRCSQPVTQGPEPKASDCLFVLNAAVGAVACAPECVCAPKGFLPTTATDALLCLRVSVGEMLALTCPCGPLPF